jgi:ABC-type transport system involved in multi-copper enzyme maturation permease subunit
MVSNWPLLIGSGFVLVLIQVLAAIPWVWALTRETLTAKGDEGAPGRLKDLGRQVLIRLLVAAGGGVVAAFALSRWTDRDVLSTIGRFYGVLLHAQLLLDLFVGFFAILLLAWPKGGAVALSAFREGIRQPLFWFLVGVGLVVMILMPFLPYFTFGEDIKMVKELGYDLIMLFAGFFAVLAAAMSITEEIEGRTAITLMSKPVSRRQFLLGKFIGILMAALMMTALLSVPFFLILWLKPVYDREPFNPPAFLNMVAYYVSGLGEAPTYLIGGMAWWFGDAVVGSVGLILGFCQVTVLLAIAVALATRLPMVVNLIICLVVFFLGNLTPVLVQVSQKKFALIQFMAQLFDHLLPGLSFFNIGPALTRDTLPAAGPFSLYMGSVSSYAMVYTAIALLFGLILFEDRDLA